MYIREDDEVTMFELWEGRIKANDKSFYFPGISLVPDIGVKKKKIGTYYNYYGINRALSNCVTKILPLKNDTQFKYEIIEYYSLRIYEDGETSIEDISYRDVK